MKIILPPLVFKEVQERSKSSKEAFTLFQEVIKEVRKAELSPLILLPEICPAEETFPSIGFDEATKLITEGKTPQGIPKNHIPITCPAFTYPKKWDYTSFLVEIFALKIALTLLEKEVFEKLIFIASPYLTKEQEIGEFLPLICEHIIKSNNYYIFVLSKERVNKFTLFQLDQSTNELLGFSSIKRAKFPIEISIKELPCWVISSPLANNPPEKAEIGNKKLIEVGMNELKSNFVTVEDLRNGREITKEEDKKKVWSIILKREREDKERVPYLRKGDILIPIKRKGSSNVAVIYDELPEEPLFIPKAGLVIVRANKSKLSLQEILTLSKILLAEFRKLSTNSFLSVSDLKAILLELFSDENFSDSLKSGKEERAFKEGRKAVKRAIEKYLIKKREFEQL